MGNLSISKVQTEIKQIIDYSSSDSKSILANINRACKAPATHSSKHPILDRFIEPVELAAKNLYLGLLKITGLIQKAVKWLADRIISILPYSSTTVFQNAVNTPVNALTKTETQRILGLKGDDGLVGCRVADGWSTFPYITTNGRMKSATRDILRLNNITIFRGPADSIDLECSMIGPNHYFGVLDDTHTYTCKLRFTSDGIPQFINTGKEPEQTLPTKSLNQDDTLIVDAAWVSGKPKDHRGEIDKKLNQKTDAEKQSLTKDIGVLVFDKGHYTLPRMNATEYDLSSFGVKLVKNDQPFQLTRSKEDPLDAVTYHFGPKYAEMAIKKRNGIFLETHDFTQIISPMTADSGGFITLGKWNNRGQLELIGVQVPFGHSIIIEKGAIHGDATFTGSYLMAMTVNHHTMATADVLHLKDYQGKNVSLTLPPSEHNHKEPSIDKKPPTFLDKGIRPLVVSGPGKLKSPFDMKILEEKEPLDKVVLTGSSVIKNPFNRAGSLMRNIS